MTAPICKTCRNPRCSNHAACARRRYAQKDWERVQVWNVVWLYIGTWRFTQAMEDIQEAEIRNFVMDSFLDDMSPSLVLFMALASSSDVECRERSWEQAARLCLR